MERLRKFANDTKFFRILRTEMDQRVTEDSHNAEGLHSAVSAKLSTDLHEAMNKQKKNLNYTARGIGFSLVLTLGKIAWSNLEYYFRNVCSTFSNTPRGQ